MKEVGEKTAELRCKLPDSEVPGEASRRHSAGNTELPKVYSQAVPNLKLCKEENSVRQHLITHCVIMKTCISSSKICLKTHELFP